MQLDNKPGTLFWTCKLAVDGDGDPRCYNPNGRPPGLDFLANAGHPGNWWGLACDGEGIPFIQEASDPAPGFFVSTTSLEDHSLAASNPRRYVNSGQIPFVVLPSKPKFSPAQMLGDLFVVFNEKSSKMTWALYADVGPANQIGEGSIALNTALGLSGDCQRGGTEEEIIAMIYFPGSAIGWPRPTDELAKAAYDHFIAWGGYESARAALPQINWDQFPPLL